MNNFWSFSGNHVIRISLLSLFLAFLPEENANLLTLSYTMLIDDNTARFLKPLSAIMHKRVKNKRNITHSAGVYLLKVNNTKTGTRSEICSKGTIKTRERSYWRRSGFLIVKLEQILHLAIVFLLLTLNM